MNFLTLKQTAQVKSTKNSLEKSGYRLTPLN